MFPKSLSMLALWGFMLRRGPLLGPILQHADDISALRQAFISANISDAMALMDPMLYFAAEAVADFRRVGCYETSLQSGHILFLDHHSTLIIWSGADTDGAKFEPIRETARRVAAAAADGRCPRPLVLEVVEGTSMTRWLQARLIPDHKDSPTEQRQHNAAALQGMEDGALQVMMGKFFQTDDLSFVQYLPAYLV